jgi:hypothetical protein
MWETWVIAQPTLKMAAKTLYPIVSSADESDLRSSHGTHPPKTEENETATKSIYLRWCHE